MARRPCVEAGCPAIIDTTRCIEHARQRDKERGTRQARGYDANHDSERAKWARIIDAGGWPCGRCDGRVQPGDDWHLDHTDDRNGYIGPSHARCNLSAAGKAAHGISPDG
jgi:hypothetical protein